MGSCSPGSRWQRGSRSSEPQCPGLLHLRQSAHLRENVGRQFAIDLDQRDGAAARRFTAYVEGRDVDAGIAQGRRELADKARLVEVGDVDHRWTELSVHPDAFDIDDTRAA